MMSTNVMLTLSIFLLLSSCGTAKSDGTYAQAVPSPNGVTCYAIFQDGKAVGGSCLK